MCDAAEADDSAAAPAAPDPLRGGHALYAVRLDATFDAWTAEMLAGIRAAAGPHALVSEWRGDEPPAALADVDAVFCWNPPPGLLSSLPALRLVASVGAGVDHCAAEHAAAAARLPRALPLVRCVDPLSAQRLASYVLWAVLHCSRGMLVAARQQARREWNAGVPYTDAAATRCGILGLGAMGSAAAAALARNGFPVRVWHAGHSERTPPEGVLPECVHAGAEALPAFLSGTDVLVLCLPLSPETRGFLNAARLALLPRGTSFLVNVGRGECVDTAALLAALDADHLAGAVLDVFDPEPPEQSSALWAHPRVVMTPHVAGPASSGTGAAQVVDAWRRVRQGRPLLNVVG